MSCVAPAFAGEAAPLARFAIDRNVALELRGGSEAEPAFAAGSTTLSPMERALGRDGAQALVRYAPFSWLSLELGIASLRTRFDNDTAIPRGAERIASAGASLHTPDGWTASLLVSSLDRRNSFVEDDSPVRPTTFVNGRISRNLTKNTRMSFDVFNVFDQRLAGIDYFSASRLWDQPGAADSFLFNPAEPRGFRLKLKVAF